MENTKQAEEKKTNQILLDKVFCSYTKETENTPIMNSFRFHIPAQKEKRFDMKSISTFNTDIKSLKLDKKKKIDRKEISEFKPKIKKMIEDDKNVLLLNSDFESSSENCSDFHLDSNFQKTLFFVQEINDLKKKKIAKKKFIINFSDFVKKNHGEKKGKKLFPCEFCDRVFTDPRAKGGHTSTKHKGKSSKFQKRTKTKKNRGIERLRNKFFKENY